MFAFGDKVWPGVSKLIEEAGETLQILGKLVQVAGAASHWDGSNLHERLAEELADLMAAARFFVHVNNLDAEAIEARAALKFDRFQGWHDAQIQRDDEGKV